MLTEIQIDPPFKTLETLLHFYNEKKLDDAEIIARKLIAEFPEHAFSWKVLGSILQQSGRISESLDAKRKAAELSPKDAETYNNLANILLANNLLDEAERNCRKALEINSKLIESHNNLAVILRKKERLSDAVESYKNLLELAPDYPNAMLNYMSLLNGLNREKEVIEFCQKFPPIANSSESVELGVSLMNSQQWGDAETIFKNRLVEIPNCVIALNNLGKIFQNQFKLQEAEDCYRKAIEVAPEHLFFAMYTHFLFIITHNDKYSSNFYLEEAKKYGRATVERVPRIFSHYYVEKRVEKKIKVGLVSGDFYRHAVSTFVEPILPLINREKFILHAYYNHSINDVCTERLKKNFTVWRDIYTQSDQCVAEQIKKDEIDILIDLSGHTGRNRLAAFAHKPAPIQISWIGFPASTGLNAMDYYLVDSDWAPEGLFDDHFVEKLVRLPSCFSFDIPNEIDVVDCPILKNGYITFGSFNRPSKITAKTLDLWCLVLNAIPTSRMLLGNISDGWLKNKLIQAFSVRHVTVERLIFHPRKATSDYLKLHSEVDVILDTLPYAGGTTTGLALSMGVPVLTYAWESLAGHAGVAWASCVDLQNDFIARTPEEFVAIAKKWSEDPSGLQILRYQLRQRMQQSPKLKPENVVRGLEKAFQMMWERFCTGLPVESFIVPNERHQKNGH